MGRSKLTTIALVVVSLVAVLALVVGCSKAPKTLEEYFKANQAEWEEIVTEVQQSGQGMMDIDLTLDGNKISQIMTFTTTYSSDQAAQIAENLANAAGTLESQIKSQIQLIEKEANIDGVTWFFDYRNGDGTSLFSMEVDGK